MPILILWAIIIIVFISFAFFIAMRSRHVTRKKSEPTGSVERIFYAADKKEIPQGTSWIKIVGNYWMGTSNEAIILLHTMPATKESWTELAMYLNREGYHVLAIDMRGHGESTGQYINTTRRESLLNYLEYSDKEHQDSIRDIEGAREWLLDHGIASHALYVGGASIGANLALQYMALHPETKAAFLLSPGIDYRGIKLNQYAVQLRDNQRVFCIGSEDDYASVDAIRDMSNIGRAHISTHIYIAGGHGTNLLTAHPNLIREISDFLKERGDFNIRTIQQKAARDRDLTDGISVGD